MRNTKLIISYDGTDYCGFQIQPNGPTIQGCLEHALSRATTQSIKINGAGRTDSGVHAEAQVVNFYHQATIPTDRFPLAINRFLPRDIRVLAAVDVPLDFHARYSAKGKTYRYQILDSAQPSVFLRNYALWVPERLNWATLERAGRMLVGVRDFASFAASGGSVKTTIRNLYRFSVRRCDSLWLLHFSADGFLYNMVRNIVGTLLEVGKGRLEATELMTLLDLRNRKYAGPTAPAHGLFLEKVHYPLDTEPRVQ